MKLKSLQIKLFSFLGVIVVSSMFLSYGNLDTRSLNEEKGPFLHYSAEIEDPIFINGTASCIGAKNWTWAENQSWCSGEGTIDNPYKINNLSIDGKENSIPIHIINSDKYFNITNCVLYNSIKTEEYNEFYSAGVVLENVSNGIIYNNNCSFNLGYGIFVRSSINITIQDNIIDTNIRGGIRIDESENLYIIRNIIDVYDTIYWNFGLNMINCNNSYIYRNQFGTVKTGISLKGYNSIIEKNILFKRDYSPYYYEDIFGIYVNGSSIILNNNTIRNFEYCLYIGEDSDYVNCTDNIIEGSMDEYNLGIRFYISGKTYKFERNKLTNCGFTISAKSNNGTIDIDTSNTVDNKPIYFYYNETDLNNLDFSYQGEPGQIILWNCNNSNIINSKISVNNFTIPILGCYCNNLSIYNNSLSNNLLGVHFQYCNYLNISNNFLFNNWRYGIAISGCLSISIINNSIYSNGNDGIWVLDSSIDIIENYIYDNGGNGIYSYSPQYKLDTYVKIINNNVKNNAENGLYLTETSNLEIANNNISSNIVYGLYFSNKNDTLLYNNTFFRNGAEGIRYFSGNIGTIRNNTFIENGFRYDRPSILITGPDNIVIFENIFIDNEIGLFISSYSENNTIYLNKFINNIINAKDDGNNNQWDNGSIGNYWDDYIGMDSNHDNIGDLPYTNIEGSANSQDRFPLWNNKTLSLPIWNEIPQNQTIEFGSNFSYTVEAFSPLGIDYYTINQTNFNIDANGIITNDSSLIIGDYWIKIYAFDIYNQNCTAIIKVSVLDNTNPIWVNLNKTQSIDIGQDFNYNLCAFDLSGIEYYWISDEINFSINNITGQITNITTLEAGTYELVVRAYDPYNNYCEDIIIITVGIVENKSIPGYNLIIFTFLFGIFSVLIFLRNKHRIKK
ncbi:MAG: right-handed parallel beta-helix repeat-containing protein [Candidatus Lokiarchaeota archaeon]|nr:right-handed parallel beta-helix repeat-containing protein [Candidatus Lokiarchaeota archaeon]